MKATISIAFKNINALINKGHERSVRAKKNILASFAIKGLSIIISLILVPITIHYINPTRYGIWITMSSIIAWFSFFDIGFGNGLRNKFAESVAKHQNKIARTYVSTTYAILSIVIIIVFGLFYFINPLINWAKILNAPKAMANELSILALVVFIFFCLQFVLKLITTVITSNQEPAKADFLNLIGSGLSLLLIFILVKTTSGNLIYLAIALGIAPVLVLFLSSIWLYTNKYKIYAPSLKYVSMRDAKNLMGLGLKFFIIQISALVLFQTDNIIITQLFGPKEVTTFNIAYKLFSIVIMAFAIIVTPLWSAFTEAYTNSDYIWMQATLTKMKKIRLILIAFTVILLLLSPILFRLWIGNTVLVPFSLSLAFCLYIFAITWQTIHVYFLNGIGKITLQLYLVIVTSIINIPLSIFLGTKFGLAGITLSSTILFTIMGICFYIQTKKIINKKAYGIWNK